MFSLGIGQFMEVRAGLKSKSKLGLKPKMINNLSDIILGFGLSINWVYQVVTLLSGTVVCTITS